MRVSFKLGELESKYARPLGEWTFATGFAWPGLVSSKIHQPSGLVIVKISLYDCLWPESPDPRSLHLNISINYHTTTTTTTTACNITTGPVASEFSKKQQWGKRNIRPWPQNNLSLSASCGGQSPISPCLTEWRASGSTGGASQL